MPVPGPSLGAEEDAERLRGGEDDVAGGVAITGSASCTRPPVRAAFLGVASGRGFFRIDLRRLAWRSAAPNSKTVSNGRRLAAVRRRKLEAGGRVGEGLVAGEGERLCRWAGVLCRGLADVESGLLMPRRVGGPFSEACFFDSGAGRPNVVGPRGITMADSAPTSFGALVVFFQIDEGRRGRRRPDSSLVSIAWPSLPP